MVVRPVAVATVLVSAVVVVAMLSVDVGAMVVVGGFGGSVGLWTLA